VLAGQAHLNVLDVAHQVEFCSRYGWSLPPVAAQWADTRRERGTKAANRWLHAHNSKLRERGSA
jgi:hypothetical protein